MFTIRFFISVVLLCVSFFSSTADNVQSIQGFIDPIQKYIQENYRIYNNMLDTLRNDMNHFRDTFEREVKVLEKVNANTKLRLENSLLTLEPLAVLSNASRTCQQHNMKIRTQKKQTFKLDGCLRVARNNTAVLLKLPNAILTGLTKYYKFKLRNSLKFCKTSNRESQNQTKCTKRAIKVANKYTMTMRTTFLTNLKESLYNAEGRIRKAVDCVQNLNYIIMYAIGETNAKIENCIEQSSRQTCPNVLQRNYKVNLPRQTIPNPLLHKPGGPKSPECLQVNFV